MSPMRLTAEGSRVDDPRVAPGLPAAGNLTWGSVSPETLR
jgi:hypothetical protein